MCNNTCNLDGLQLTVHIAGAHIPVPAFSAEDERIIATWGKRNEVWTGVGTREVWGWMMGGEGEGWLQAAQ